MADRKTLELQIQLIAERASAQLKTFATDVKHAAENAKGFSGNSKSVASSIKAMQEEAKRTAASIKLFGDNTNALRNTTSRMKATILDLIQGGLKPESQEVQNLVKQYKNLESQLDSTERQQNGFLGMLGEIKNEIGSLAIAASALAVDKALVGFASGALEVNNSFQAARDNFGIMLNDMEAGRGLFNELQEFNFWTPFDIETTAKATAVLRTAKVELNDITKYLTRFGDLSRGNAQTMQSFTNAFSKASAKGKADMEVLNVFIDQGVQILDQLAKQMGTTSAQIVKMASEGKISFADLDRAIAELTSEGGQYYNTMATAAMRLDAVQAGLEESTKSLRASFGEMLAPAVAKVLGFFTYTVDAINRSPIVKGILAGAVVALTVAINALAVKAIVPLIAKLWAAYAAQMGLNSAMAIANPALLALIGTAAAATAGFVAYAASQQKVADATAALSLEQQKLNEQLSSSKWMENLSLEGLQSILANYRNTIIPYAEKLKKEAEEKLSKIPQTISVIDDEGTGELHVVTKQNPKYKEALAAVEEQTKRLREYGVLVKSIEGEIQDRIAEHANAIAAFGTEWQDKLASETPSILAEQERALAKLNKKAEEAFGEKYKTEEAYLKEVEALNKFYDKKREEELQKRLENEKKALQLLNKWLYSGNNAKQLEQEKKNSMAELQKYSNELLKKGYIVEAEQRKALFNMEMDYEKRIHAAKLADLENYRELDAERIANSAKDSALSSGGELGQVLKAFESDRAIGGLMEAAKQLSSAIMTSVGSLENGNKVLNPFTTLINSMMEILGPFINEILAPTAELLEEIGKFLGSLLKPFAALQSMFVRLNPIMIVLLGTLELVGNIFEGLYMIIEPFAKAIAKFYNWIVSLLSKIGINLKKVTLFEETVTHMTEEAVKAQELLKKRYERLLSSVDDLLNSQLDALKSQYDLGLISRDDYQTQAEKYAKAADEKRYELEKEMNENLKKIASNTYAGLSDDQKEAAKSGWEVAKENVAGIPVVGGLLETGIEVAEVIYDAGKKVVEGAIDAGKKVVDTAIDVGKKAWNAITGWFDVGTPEIPYDQIAMVHQGETIIPKTFAEGIRSGELALVGKNDRSQSSAGSPIIIQMNIEGSVVTENQIVDAVYSGIAKGIQQKKYTPLPGVAV